MRHLLNRAAMHFIIIIIIIIIIIVVVVVIIADIGRISGNVNVIIM
jgi:hypothetical protein